MDIRVFLSFRLNHKGLVIVQVQSKLNENKSMEKINRLIMRGFIQ